MPFSVHASLYPLGVNMKKTDCNLRFNSDLESKMCVYCTQSHTSNKSHYIFFSLRFMEIASTNDFFRLHKISD